MSKDLQSGSRSGSRAKRKKTNIILNGLIVIVLALIIFVAYNIFSSGNDKASTNKVSSAGAQKQTLHKESKKSSTAAKDNNSSDNTSSGNANAEQSTEASTPGTVDNSQAVVTEGGSTPNVTKSVENPDWKPVGTSQTGQHTPVYDSSSTDWQEMLSAISYATGLDQSNMTVWFLGRDKSTGSGSVGTVSSKDKQQKYKVYIQWVDGQGWKPTKVEVLSDIRR
ncbi:DUF1510 family protein [Neobacillus ginsengisoli]|uniref:Cytoskeletal protein RodZ n=1 Tax=Neobacillus ginsengisoli TaxID=904295 RepID=A0ABT9XQH5_9BACI|nr:DUF1510 family protein [Neobacillus ginsengisoli]MDQ0197202.1 cytoskeletal protein RodZ [Neobacillus ginsengisoli]